MYSALEDVKRAVGHPVNTAVSKLTHTEGAVLLTATKTNSLL
jgi:hypothetical protein